MYEKKIKSTSTNELFNLEGKVTVITGAGGIGSTLAKAFDENGSEVIVADLDENIVENLRCKIGDICDRIETYKMDVTSRNSIEYVLDNIIKKHSRIDVLIHTAGIGKSCGCLEFSDCDIEKIIDVNLKGTIFTNQCVGKIMANQGFGKIINIGSIAGHMTHTMVSMPYAASKAGVHQVTRTFATELAKYNINVNAIAPTWVNTQLIAGKDKQYYENINRSTPFGRMLETEELVGIAIFLATDSSNFVTGQTIFIDGGWSASKLTF